MMAIGWSSIRILSIGATTYCTTILLDVTSRSKESYEGDDLESSYYWTVNVQSNHLLPKERF